MWPKVFAQLMELLPHITRLVPMADVFFQTRTASEKANEAAVAALVKDVRTDLSHVTAAHDGLYRQLQAQRDQLAQLAVDGGRNNAAVERLASGVTEQARQIAALRGWLLCTVVLLVLVLAVLITLLLRAH